MINKFDAHINRVYVIISLKVVLALGLFMLFFYAPWFSSQANGYPYMETRFFYTPTILFEMAEGYGAQGRALYIKTSMTLDFLVPLLASNFMVASSLYILKKIGGREKDRKKFIFLGAVTCTSDWIENILMISILKTYPKQIMLLAVMGRIMTSIKYILMLIFVIVMLREFYLMKKSKL